EWQLGLVLRLARILLPKAEHTGLLLPCHCGLLLRFNFSKGRRAPQMNDPVRATGSQSLAVGIEIEVVARHFRPQNGDFAESGQIPQPHGAIVTGTGQTFAIVRKSYSLHTRLMSAEGRHL